MLNKMRSHETLAVARILICALLLMSLLAAASFAQDQFDSAGEKQLVELINQERSRGGLPPLAVDERLTQSACKHTEVMVKHKTLPHQCDEEATCNCGPRMRTCALTGRLKTLRLR